MGHLHAAYVIFSGSANWADLAFGDDEQMQRMSNKREALRHNAAFAKTWRQQSSEAPSYARVVAFGRGLPAQQELEDAPVGRPPFGHGIYRYMPPD